MKSNVGRSALDSDPLFSALFPTHCLGVMYKLRHVIVGSTIGYIENLNEIPEGIPAETPRIMLEKCLIKSHEKPRTIKNLNRIMRGINEGIVRGDLS